MGTDLSKILDECILRISKGEAIEACLDEYSDLREQLEPLLYTALSISTIPRVSPSDEFRRVSKARLMARIVPEFSQTEAASSDQRIPLLNWLTVAWEKLLPAITGARRIAIPIAIALVLVLGASLSGAFDLLSPPTTLASQCTLSILSGSVEIQNPGADTRQQGTDGMTLTVGTRVKTAPGSHALLTFFEGSTIKLEPNTDVEIQQVEYSDEQSTTIVLKQWLGRTWSRVVKMADPGSHYQIETPSATAVVRGTLFATEVEETGFTKVTTTEGLVSVAAQDEEVYVPANHKTQVEKGIAPTQSVTVPSPKSEIIITIDMPAVGSVRDPTGSSTGILPSGLPFNQIPGSRSSSPSNATQIITITEPMTGEYIITLRYISKGIARFNIQGKTEDKVVFTYTGNWGAVKDNGRLIYLNLYVDDGLIVSSDLSAAERLGDEMPEKIVEVELAGKRAKPIKTEAQDSDIQDDSADDKKDTKDTDDTDVPADKGRPSDKKDTDDTDVPADKERPSDKKDTDDKDVPGGKGRPNDKKDTNEQSEKNGQGRDKDKKQ